MKEDLSTTETTTAGQQKYEYSGILNNDEEHVALIENVGTGTNDVYYLVVEYENDTSKPQNDEQGKTFTVELDVAPQA